MGLDAGLKASSTRNFTAIEFFDNVLDLSFANEGRGGMRP
jgi:hypothetical protein